MVIQSEKLDLVFGALADPTRRRMLEQLATGASRVGDLGPAHPMSQPAVSKHVRVLERAGLIQRERIGREHRISVDPRPIEAARTWIGHYARFWQEQFNAVDEYLKTRSREAQKEQEDA